MQENSHISQLWTVLENKLSGMPKPEQEDLKAVYDNGIRAIVSLLEDESSVENYENNGFEKLWLPVTDHGAPTLAQVEKLVEFIDEQNEKGNQVVLHCKGGKGRTGTMIASYLIAKGASFDEAIAQIDDKKPNAIRKEAQIEFLKELANK